MLGGPRCTAAAGDFEGARLPAAPLATGVPTTLAGRLSAEPGTCCFLTTEAPPVDSIALPRGLSGGVVKASGKPGRLAARRRLGAFSSCQEKISGGCLRCRDRIRVTIRARPLLGLLVIRSRDWFHHAR